MHSLLRSIAEFSSSSSSSPSVTNCSFSRESASVYANYLRSRFSGFQPNPLRSKARGYLSEFRLAVSPKESCSPFCSPFSSTEFLAAAAILSSSTTICSDRVAYPTLSHIPRSGMDLLYIFNLSRSLIFLSFTWETSLIPIHKMGKPFYSPALFRPISLTSCVSMLFERIILSRLLFVLDSNSILCAVSPPGRFPPCTVYLESNFSYSILDGFNKLKPDSQTILANIDFSKAFDFVRHPALFDKLISAELLPSFACYTQSFLV